MLKKRYYYYPWRRDQKKEFHAQSESKSWRENQGQAPGSQREVEDCEEEWRERKRKVGRRELIWEVGVDPVHRLSQSLDVFKWCIEKKNDQVMIIIKEIPNTKVALIEKIWLPLIGKWNQCQSNWRRGNWNWVVPWSQGGLRYLSIMSFVFCTVFPGYVHVWKKN